MSTNSLEILPLDEKFIQEGAYLLIEISLVTRAYDRIPKIYQPGETQYEAVAKVQNSQFKIQTRFNQRTSN